MCTVTFVPLANNEFILSSNRDESPLRKTAPPIKHHINGITALYPTDLQAGGTWIGTSDLQRVVCIMNGGFEPYDMNQPFAKSRGLIVKEVLTTPSLTKYFTDLDLSGIAPFTLIVLLYNDGLSLKEYIWDGKQLFKKDKPIKNTIWSSRQLYTPKVAAQRESWFAQFLSENALNQDNLLHFHTHAGDSDPKTDLVMNRGKVKTTSISSFVKDREVIRFSYQALDSGQIVNTNL